MKSKSKLPLLIILIIFAIASISISVDKSFWRDEVFSYHLASQPILSLISSTARDFTPPLFYLPLHFFVKIFSKEYLLRLLPLSFSLATIYLAYLVSIHFKFKKIPQIIFLTIISSSFSLLYYSTELRAYSLQMFLTLFSLIFTYQSLFSKNKKYLTYLSITNTLLLYTHSTALIFVACEAFSVLLYSFLKSKTKLKSIFLSYLFSLIFFLPWLFVILRQSQVASSSFWIELTPKETINQYHGLFYINEHLSGDIKKLDIFKYFFRFSIFLTIAGIITSIKKYPKTIFTTLSYLLTLLAFYIFSLTISPILYQRYIAFLSPITMIYIAIFLIQLFQSQKIFGSVIFLSYLLLTAKVDYLYLIKRPAKTDFRILTNLNTPLYTQDQGIFLTCSYYYSDCYLIGKLEEVSQFTGITQLDPSLFKTIDSWQDITDPNFSIIYNWQFYPEVKENFELNYNKTKAFDLGDNIWVEEYSLIN